MCRILKIRQNTASHSASAEYSAKLPNIRLRQPAEDYSVHPYFLPISTGLIAMKHVQVRMYAIKRN